MIRRASLVLPAVLFACAHHGEQATASDAELHLEEGPIPTALTELRAGLPYLPGIDESPVAIGGPCVANPTLTITPGQVGSTAAIVQTRESLSRELGLGISGSIPVAGGITGAVGLTYTTSFDDQSAVVLFQSTGTYESVLAGASSLTSYDPDAIARCGFGYVARASHRVTAALVVTVRAISDDKDLQANLGLGKTGIAEAKANISNLIKRGQVEISIHFATDVIPGLPQAPFADSLLVVGTSENDKQNAQEKLARSLAWLADAQSTIETYLSELRADAAQAPAAPARSIIFRYYPGTPSSVRASVDRAVGHANDTKVALRKARGFVDAWEQYEHASNRGTNHEWNIPLAPATTVADLDAKKRAALLELRPHTRQLEDNLDACVRSLRYDRAKLDHACVAAPAFPIDERANDIRHIAYLSTEQTQGAGACPDGQRLPKESEAPLFSPWSKARAKAMSQGLWSADSGCFLSGGWIYDGAPACSNVWVVDKGLRICVSSASGPMPALD